MELACKINNKIYKIVQGATFSEEYNETLDSGCIIIDHVTKIRNLKPYVDVYIYDDDYVYLGYQNVGDHYIDENGDEQLITESVVWFRGLSGDDESYALDDEDMPFFKHMLVDSFTEEMLDLRDDSKDTLYKYKINLFSETKGLEKVPVPNISITQPIASSDASKRTCYEYLNNFINLYSPELKFKNNLQTNTWIYNKKYKLSPTVAEIFDENVFCPEMTFTNPTLREVLSRIMTVKDCIPIVKNGMVYALDISQRNGTFQVDANHINFINNSMSSDSYANGARRQYSGAISQNSSARYIEYLGFRNENEAFMTLENMYIETRFPIYKINSIKMCYYKGVQLKYSDGSSKETNFLVQQDITDLVLQNNIRNAMSNADWATYRRRLDDTNVYPERDELKNYKIFTIGYDIGSNKITGWGTKYSYYDFVWFKNTYTYIQNIYEILDKINQLGDGAEASIAKIDKKIIAANPLSGVFNLGSSDISPYKLFLFKIDYNAMFDGSIIHSKDNIDDDDIMTVDNSSTALSILETDGLFEKEKLNRMSNKTVRINGRYDSYEEMNNTYNNILGSVYGDDVVIYHREYQIYDDCVICNFIGTYDYVLKNYFTSVFAKLRNYNLMPYSEAIKRDEVFKYSIILSLDKCYYEIPNYQTLNYYYNALMSGFFQTPSPIFVDSYDYQNVYLINGGWFTFNDVNYWSDINKFAAGYSLCFNIKMFDNISNGVYITKWDCYSKYTYVTSADEEGGTTSETVSGDYSGSAQQWLLATNNVEDAFIESVGIYIGHLDTTIDIFDSGKILDAEKTSAIYDTASLLPKMSSAQKNTIVSSIGDEMTVYKDNKEQLNITFQYEPVSYDNDNILFSQWLMKLSDMLGIYHKFTGIEAIGTNIFNKFDMPSGLYAVATSTSSSDAYIGFKIASTDFSSVIKANNYISVYKQLGLFVCKTTSPVDYSDAYLIFQVEPVEITQVSSSSVTIKIKITEQWIGQQGLERTVYVNSEYTSNIITDNGYNYLFFKVAETGWDAFNHLITNLHVINRKEDGTLYSFNELEDIFNYSEMRKQVESSADNLYDYFTNNIYTVLSDAYAGKPIYVYANRTVYILASTSKLDKTLVYQDMMIENDEPVLLDGYENIEIPDNNLADIISLAQENDGKPYIYLHNIDSYLSDTYKSIQYWFYDEIEGRLKFVFGVNLTDKMRSDGYAKIYFSLVKHRSTKVYDEYHNFTAENLNYVGEDVESSFGEAQYYNDIVIAQISYVNVEDSTDAGDVYDYITTDGEETGFIDTYLVI